MPPVGATLVVALNETIAQIGTIAPNGTVATNGTIATNRDCRLYGRIAFANIGRMRYAPTTLPTTNMSKLLGQPFNRK